MVASGKNISLVLGSGGARGLAHIGVIRWLEENGYRIASVTGCSIGKFSSRDWTINATSILAAISWKSTFFPGVFLLSKDLRFKISWIIENVFSS